MKFLQKVATQRSSFATTAHSLG